MKTNRPIPQWVRLRTGNSIRWVSLRIMSVVQHIGIMFIEVYSLYVYPIFLANMFWLCITAKFDSLVQSYPSFIDAPPNEHKPRLAISMVKISGLRVFWLCVVTAVAWPPTTSVVTAIWRQLLNEEHTPSCDWLAKINPKHNLFHI